MIVLYAGLANPAPIIQTFYAEDVIYNDVKLDGVVTLVDAKHVGLRIDEVKPDGVVNEAVEQIAYADRIIVNKVYFLNFLCDFLRNDQISLSVLFFVKII